MTPQLIRYGMYPYPRWVRYLRVRVRCRNSRPTVYPCQTLRLLVHNILSNPDFKDMFDTSPYQEYDMNDNHRYHDFLSGNWAWRHAVSFIVIMHVLISRLIGICRISSLKMLQHTGLCLCQSFSAAIRQPFPSPQDTQNIGRSISPLEISIIMLDMRTRTALFF
jgi:hypothetical protein